MKSFAAAVALISLVPGIVCLTIDTPASVVQCQPSRLTWHDGTPPYFLSIIPGGQPSAPAIKSFDTQQGTSITWVVDLQANTGITISLKDSTGTQAYSDIVTISSSSDSSCLNGASPSGGSSAVGSAAASSAAGATGAATSTGVTGTTASPSSSNAPVSAAASSIRPSGSSASPSGTAAHASTSSNAASHSGVRTVGLAGLLGFVGAALL